MSGARHITSDQIDKACCVLNSIGDLNNIPETVRAYFTDIISIAPGVTYINAATSVEPNHHAGQAWREVVTMDGEKILQINIDGLEPSAPFLYYQSSYTHSYFFKENSRTVVELNERDLTYRIIDNADTTSLNTDI